MSLLAGLVVGAGVLAAPVTAAATTRPPNPAVQSCPPGPSFAVLDHYPDSFLGFGTAFESHNGTENPVTVTKSVSGSGTSSMSVTASGSVDFDVIFASVQASVSATLTQSQTVGGSEEASITIPVGDYGIIQYGNWRVYTRGNYQVVTSDCAVTTNKTFDTLIPKKADGYDTAVNKTGSIPWDQD